MADDPVQIVPAIAGGYVVVNSDTVHRDAVVNVGNNTVHLNDLAPNVPVNINVSSTRAERYIAKHPGGNS